MNRYDDDDMPLTDIDYNGVVYEPSSQTNQPNNSNHINHTNQSSVQSRQPQRNNQRQSLNSSVNRRQMNTGGKPPTKKLKPQKSYYKTFMLITIISGIVICIVIASLVFNAMSGTSSTPSVPETPTTPALEGNKIIADVENSKVGSTITGVIKVAEQDKRQFTFISFEDNKTYTFKVTGTTELKDKYNNSISLQEFSVGDIVDFVYDKDKRLTSLHKSSEGWTEQNITGVKINTDSRTVEYKNKSYTYSELLNFTFKNEPADISALDEIDVVTITGYNNTVYSINIEKGHGILQITNKNDIKDGIIEIDNSIHKNLSEAGSFKVSEGTHKVIVKGSNCDNFTSEFIVEANETKNVDLSAVKIKTGILLIKTNVSDYLLSINDTPELSREPLVLEYGAYTIKVQKEGYTSFETQIVLNKEQATINVELKKEVEMGKVTINSTPENAEVYIDNAKVGYTPVSLEVTVGKHNIRVNKDGYTSVEYTGIDVTSKDNIYNITMQPSSNSINSTTNSSSNTNSSTDSSTTNSSTQSSTQS